MKKKKAPESSGAGMGWLVTFTDLMTLLLTFFVLLLSMASMDRSVLRTMTTHISGQLGMAPRRGAGKVPIRFELVQKMIENSEIMLEDPRRLRDTLFPEEILPDGMAKSTLEENLQVLLRPEGVALVLSDKLLFPTGQYELNEQSKRLLSELSAFMASVPAPVNIAGYSDNIPAANPDNYALSGRRAMAVLRYFLEQDFAPSRFSVSAYGPSFPVTGNTDKTARAKNRRVEILLKTANRSYL